MSTWKLQKLVYYAQAWSLVWDEELLFHEPIQAWANGPVVPALYAEHRGMFRVEQWQRGDPGSLDEEQRKTVDTVLKHYGAKSGQQLSELTHRELPWREARKGLDPDERGTHEIEPSALGEYYSSIYESQS
jgi:uncharacterized phage-associated protein